MYPAAKSRSDTVGFAFDVVNFSFDNPIAVRVGCGRNVQQLVRIFLIHFFRPDEWGIIRISAENDEYQSRAKCKMEMMRIHK